MWAHQGLDVYHKAIEAAVALDRLARSVPSARRDLRDQLLRASASVPLNVAEGAGEPAEKARFYRMARRSAAECVAILDLLDGIFRPQLPSALARRLLADVAAMLTALARRHSTNSGPSER